MAPLGDHFGVFLGALWPPFATSWAHFGLPLGRLGLTLDLFGALGCLLGGPGGCLGLHLDPFGTTLVVLEAFLDAILVTLVHF